jgi:hypothetical protein
MKEIVFYTIVALSSLFILGFSIHMLIGGLVSPQTERWIITGACLVGAGVIAAMAADVIRRRRSR